jgi:hypothetical protein
MRRKNKHVVIMLSKLKRYQYVKERKEMGIVSLGHGGVDRSADANARRLGIHYWSGGNIPYIQPLQVAKTILILAIIWPLAIIFLSL